MIFPGTNNSTVLFYSFKSLLISIFFICRNALVTLSALSGSFIKLERTEGIICYESPYLSFSQWILLQHIF
jgi:hypothetical protein